MVVMVDVVGVVLEQMMVVVVAMLVAEKLRNILSIFPLLDLCCKIPNELWF